ncbi:hypothetical protein J6590_023413 [Homalodisca vitripennis]|nr:hypothetical protein J6590_023413 [Homalodisca vitripennis]
MESRTLMTGSGVCKSWLRLLINHPTISRSGENDSLDWQGANAGVWPLLLKSETGEVSFAGATDGWPDRINESIHPGSPTRRTAHELQICVWTMGDHCFTRPVASTTFWSSSLSFQFSN